MTSNAKFRELERQLNERGLSEETRKKLRNSKICIIDDKITQLKSMVLGLKREGFTNLIELQKVESVNALLDANFDVIVLDLADVAPDIDDEDGLGVLQKLKAADPYLPIIVVTGNEINPSFVKRANLADLIRHKPVLSADLAADVEQLLKVRKDSKWGSLAVLKALEQMSLEGTSSAFSVIDRIQLYLLKQRILSDVVSPNGDPVEKITKAAKILTKYGGAAAMIAKLCQSIAS